MYNGNPSSFRAEVPQSRTVPQYKDNSLAVIQKIEALYPYMREIVDHNETKMNKIIGKLVSLRDGLDTVFIDLERDLDQGEAQNMELKSRLANTQLSGVSPMLVRTLEEAKRENARLNQEEGRARQELLQTQKENEKTFALLDEMKLQSQRLLAKNKNLEQYREIHKDGQSLKAHIKEERLLSMDQEAKAKKKYSEYERDIGQKKESYNKLRNMKDSLKGDKQQSIRDILRELQNEKTLCKKLAENVKRKTKELEDQNEEMNAKIEIQSAEVASMQQQFLQLQGENINAIRVIKELEQQTEKERDYFDSLKEAAEQERRQSMANEDLLVRKLNQLEQGKKKLQAMVNEQARKGDQYEHELEQIQEQYTKERNMSMGRESMGLKKLQQLGLQREQLKAMLNKSANGKKYTQEAIRKMQKEGADREKQLVKAIDQLSRKSNVNEQELLFLKNQIEKERRKSQMDVAKLKKLEGVVANSVGKLTGEVDALEREIEAERRKSMQDVEKIKTLELTLNEKVYLISEVTRKKDAQTHQVEILRDQIQKERSKSMRDQAKIAKMTEALQGKAKALEKEEGSRKARDEDIQALRRMLEEERRKTEMDDQKIKATQSQLEKKLKEANEAEKKVRKQREISEKEGQEIQTIRDLIEEERRKSLADEDRIKKLQYLLAEKFRIMDGMSARKTMLQKQMQELVEEVRKERSKSIADQATIKKLEGQLKKKTQQANIKQDMFYASAEKIKLTLTEVGYLRKELDNQRRKSTADQDRIRKFEAILKDKEERLEQVQGKMANEEAIKNLEDALEEQRRKSSADVQKIKRLEKELKKRTEEAMEYNRQYGEAERKSALTKEEIQKIKEQLERERRESMLSKDGIIRKIRELEQENLFVYKQLQERKDNLEGAQEAAEMMTRKAKQLEKALKDIGAATEEKEGELGKVKEVLEDQRRKSLSVEQLARDLSAQLLKTTADINKYKQELLSLQRKSQELSEKVAWADKHIDELAEENSRLQSDSQRGQSKTGQSKRAEERFAQLQRTLESITSQIRARERDIAEIREELQRKKGELDEAEEYMQNVTREGVRSSTTQHGYPPNGYAPSGNSQQNLFLNQGQAGGSSYTYTLGAAKSEGVSSRPELTEDKKHAIKVLQHENKVYNFEENVLRQSD